MFQTILNYKGVKQYIQTTKKIKYEMIDDFLIVSQFGLTTITVLFILIIHHVLVSVAAAHSKQ